MTEINDAMWEQDDAEYAKNLFGGDWQPEVMEDQEIDFDKPIKGKYVGELKEVTNNTGEKDGKPWENIKLKIQITEDVEGDKSFNRFMDKVFWAGTNDWNDDPEKWLKDSCSFLATIGAKLPAAGTKEAVLQALNAAIGKPVCMRCYVAKEKQRTVIVKEFKKDEPKKEMSFM